MEDKEHVGHDLGYEWVCLDQGRRQVRDVSECGVGDYCLRAGGEIGSRGRWRCGGGSCEDSAEYRPEAGCCGGREWIAEGDTISSEAGGTEPSNNCITCNWGGNNSFVDSCNFTKPRKQKFLQPNKLKRPISHQNSPTRHDKSQHSQMKLIDPWFWLAFYHLRFLIIKL